MCHATGMTVAHLLGHASTQILPTYIRPFDENTKALIVADGRSPEAQKSRIGFHQLKLGHLEQAFHPWKPGDFDHVLITVTLF